MGDLGGWLWMLLAIGVAIFAAAMVYGTVMWRQRRKDRPMKRAQEEVTREQYRRNNE